MNANKSRYIDTLLVFSVIAVSTIPFFKNSIGVSLLLVCFGYLYKKIFVSVKKESLLILCVVFAIEIYHLYYFKNYETWVFWHVILYFFTGMFTVYYLKLSFITIYIKILYITTLISFIFFISLLVSPDTVHLFAESMPSIFKQTIRIYQDDYVVINPIVYNFDHNFYKIRNNGPFWEPTVFASLLLIAQIFNLLISREIFNKWGKVFTIGIITTFSTTVFIAYFIFVVFYFLINNKFKLAHKISFTVVGLSVGIYLFFSLSFLEEKINTEFVNVSDNMETRGDSRVASALLDINEINQEDIYLFLGKGNSRNSRIGGLDKDVLRNCGLTALLIEWGIPFFILYIVLLYYSFYHLSKHYQISTLFAIPFTLIILIVSFSEIFLDLPLFHCFIFLGFVVKRYYRLGYHPQINNLDTQATMLYSLKA